ncbi:MAG: AI-2E family transporter [Patescibacteria group bacterium]
MHTSLIEKYFLFALLAIVIVLTIAIFWPFITVVVLAGAFAVVLEPVYLWIKRRITKGTAWLASVITVILFLIILCGPLFFIGTVIFNQAQDVYHLISGGANTNELVQRIDASINNAMPNGFTFDMEAKIHDLGVFLSNNVTSFFTATFNSLLMFLIMILTIFYILKDGEHWRKNLVSLSPLSDSHVEEILNKLKSAINRILKGSFLIAIAQGILAGIGLTIFGVPSPALWGVVAGMASFVPTIGVSIVTVPAILFLYFTGAHLPALGLLLWALLLVGMIDNFLAPYVISKNTEIPSLFILFSILGGVALMGPVGVLIGPLVLSLLYSLVSIYRKEIKHS